METKQIIRRFVIASIAMWIFPLTILYIYNNYLASSLSPRWTTLYSGFLAVLSVNAVIAFYIYMAMKEPKSSPEPQPDPTFASKARSTLQETSDKKTE